MCCLCNILYILFHLIQFILQTHNLKNINNYIYKHKNVISFQIGAVDSSAVQPQNSVLDN